MLEITYEEYLDKVRGGWFGKCLGGAAGAPVEGIKKLIDVKDFKDILNPELPNDDLDLQLLWLDVLEKKGLDINSRDLADAWNVSCWYPFMEYGIFLKNYERGIYPPHSGSFNNPIFSEGNGCPIRSEIWGFIFPGNPELAARYAEQDGVLDHVGNSVWIEKFFSAMESMAFFNNDINELIETGKRFLPQESKAYRCVEEITEYYGKYPEDWTKARNQAIRLFGHHDFTNSTINLAFVLIGLLYGRGSLEETINIALKCGYDTDCTCATAASVLGTILGLNGINPDLQRLIDDKFVIGIDVKRENNSIGQLSSETCALGIEGTKYLNRECRVIDIPEDTRIIRDKEEIKPVSIEIVYCKYPAVGFNDSCDYNMVIKNTSENPIKGTLLYEKLPEGWMLTSDKAEVSLVPGEVVTLKNTVILPETVRKINNTNILQGKFWDSNGVLVKTAQFGIAGASVWKVAGPYFEPLEKACEIGMLSPHNEGSILPTLECMVNNSAYLHKEYICEEAVEDSIRKEDHCIMNAYEDLLPIDENFTFKGQGCFYLLQEIESIEDREVWVVIGNNDGYRLWVNGELQQERDEVRLWTPYNNSGLIKLSKGSNKIVLKLLRRTERLKFSFGLRKYNGQHWHKNRWFVDFVSKI